MRYVNTTIGVIALSLLAGCAVLHTPYQQAAVATPAEWQHSAGASAANVTSGDRWWQHFNDPQLNQLIELALARNNDLATAAILVRRAQWQAGLTAPNPTVSLGFSTGNSRNLRAAPNPARSQSLSATVSYELDLWGKLSS